MISVDHLSTASKMLLLPLYDRAVESCLSAPVIIDSIASDLVRRIDFDFAALAGRDLESTRLESVLNYLDWRERRIGPMRWLFAVPPLSSGSRILRYSLHCGCRNGGAGAEK